MASGYISGVQMNYRRFKTRDYQLMWTSSTVARNQRSKQKHVFPLKDVSVGHCVYSLWPRKMLTRHFSMTYRTCLWSHTLCAAVASSLCCSSWRSFCLWFNLVQLSPLAVSTTTVLILIYNSQQEQLRNPHKLSSPECLLFYVQR